jgi:hypothetical protein
MQYHLPKNRSQVKRVFGRKSFRKQQYVGSLRRHHDFGKRQSVSQRAIPVEKIDPLISAIFM